MSRRPSSITITSDDTTILCADKFGDVYALPLLPLPDDDQIEQSATPAPEQPEQRLPSATALTVHSGRNRRTLEEQLKQKAKGPAKSKEPMKFKHDLLLGHVSMLTDVVYTKVDNRGYIITADRDEHVRISRGQPQAHIIEGFCFGHEAFVSRLCLTRSGLLVSGGGDDQLFIWDWQNYRLFEKLALKDSIWALVQSFPHLQRLDSVDAPADYASFKVAVSGIWNLPSNGTDVRIMESPVLLMLTIRQIEEIVVACEGVPALFRTTLGSDKVKRECIVLHGNVLDVAFASIPTSTTSNTMIISIDNIHKPGSTTEVRNDKVIKQTRSIIALTVVNNRRYLDCNTSHSNRTGNGGETRAWKVYWKASQTQDSTSK
jgi:tRNA (guanine-N(7)-)-methyltransferase subunit TRM82